MISEKITVSMVLIFLIGLSFSITHNGWQLPEGGAFGAIYFLFSINLVAA
jgi:hypothetical protein